MRITGLVLTLLAFVTNADSSLFENTSDRTESGYTPPVPGGAVLFDQAYSGLVQNVVKSTALYNSADDFILTEAGQVESIEWWSLYVSEQTGSFRLRIYANDCDSPTVPGAPGDILWEVLDVSVENTDTGDDFYGYDIYHTEIILDSSDYFQAEVARVYWLSIYYNETDFYWCTLDGGNLYTAFGQTWHSFDSAGLFRLNGTPYQALEATTWAAIKRGF